MPPEEPEQDVTVAHVREAQSIAGEILWIALRSRPDLSYAVSTLGRQVTKNPRWAVALGEQILEYLNKTPELYLFYGPCRPGDRGPDGDLPKERSMNLVGMYSDVSFAPQGGRSARHCCHVGWCAHPVGDFQANLHGSVNRRVRVVLLHRGDHHGGLGQGRRRSPMVITWRPSRHLRLRASVLKERLQEGSWRIFHLDGKRLIADVFTKAIVDKNVLSWFKRFVHFQAPEGGTRETEVVAEVTEVVTEAKSKAKMVEAVTKVAKLALCMAGCAAATCLLTTTRVAVVASLAIGMAYVVKSSGVLRGVRDWGSVRIFPTGEFSMN